MNQEPISTEWAQIFERSERESAVRKKLAEGFDDYGYVLTWREYIGYLRTGQTRLKELVDSLAAGPSTRLIVRTINELRFIYFSVLSVHLAIENYLYEGSKGLRCAAGLSPLIDRWKYLPQVQLAKALRNRVQHGALAGGTVHVEVRSVHHKAGKGAAAVLEMGDDIWAKLITEVSARSRADARAFVDEVLSDEADSLLALTTEYLKTLEALDAEIEGLFRSTYVDEYAEKDKLLGELGELQSWLSSQGIGSELAT